MLSYFQGKARAFLMEANDAGYAMFITWGRRTPEQIKAVGASKNGQHLYGMAFDVQIWDPAYEGIWPGDGDPVRLHKTIYQYAPITAETDPRFKKIGSIGKSVGLQWGGEIFGSSYYDPVHFQIR